jgi:hypothetical protein
VGRVLLSTAARGGYLAGNVRWRYVGVPQKRQPGIQIMGSSGSHVRSGLAHLC